MPLLLNSTFLALCWAVLHEQADLVPLEVPAGATFHFQGPLGQRLEANARQWLLRAPAANPGMLSMFSLRDRQPRPNLVPWAGEFAGKYLISAIQALALSQDPELEKTVRLMVKSLMACQAEDGYLGPFPRDIRLKANWDLWGHYHCLLALMMWYERTGDRAALATCRRAADFICKTFLDTGKRIIDVGSDEMNLAVIHSLGRLYRHTRETRYLRMMREIEKDWERAGDYLRTGLAGVEYYRTPRPRWESFHDLQGLVELYQITGEARYRTAFLNHWQSIRRWERHNNGAFSSGEQATGDPYQNAAIETCCTVAWMAITVDALRLTGDSLAADELELSTFNGLAGAQHPSGSWFTYNTPMNGLREASHHSIVFQARAGTPDLNCCSVNGPRGLGMLGDWAVMCSQDGLAINYFGPMQATFKVGSIRGTGSRDSGVSLPLTAKAPNLAEGTPVTIRQETRYPLDDKVCITIQPERPVEFTLKVRVPAWSADTKIQWPGASARPVRPGTYAMLRRVWQPGDQVKLQLDLRLRYESGDGAMFGRMSIYRGPVLLAFDVCQNTFDEADLPVLAPSIFNQAKVSFPPRDVDGERVGRFAPWLVVELPASKGRLLRLCDYASAGSSGSPALSWLPGRELIPPPPVPSSPADRTSMPSGQMLFTCRRPLAADRDRKLTVVVSETPDCSRPVLQFQAKAGSRLVVPAPETKDLRPGVDYYWKLIAQNAFGVTESLPPAKRFRIHPGLPPLGPEQLSEYGEGPGGVLVASDLAGEAKPSYGRLVLGKGFRPAAGINGKPNGAVQLDGKDGMLVWGIRQFPSYEYTVALWFAHEQKDGRFGQVFSAWARGMDDPLRICLDKDKLYARIEAGNQYSTPGIVIEPRRWYHVAAVKSGTQLTLYLDGKPVASIPVPVEVVSSARDFALGGNPHYTGSSEHLACRLARLAVHVRAFSPQEVAQLFLQQRPR